MDLTVFQYITEIPVEITNEMWFELACKGYNLGLTAVWFLILWFTFDTLFTALSKMYQRGHD